MTIYLYAAAISDALENKRVAIGDLIKLRDQAYEQIKAQGDLATSLVRLQEEIDRQNKER